MKKSTIFPALCALAALLPRDAASMDGKYVTVVNPAKTMLLSTIRGNAVTARQTIGADQVDNPQFSFDGTRIAYWRSNGGHWYLSVLDVATTTSTNLLDVTAWAGSGQGPLRWPAGDWIYFEKPTNTGEIWRISSTDPTKKELVLDYTKVNSGAGAQKIYSFYLAADIHVAMTAINDIVWYSGHGGQYVHRFPPSADDPGSTDNLLINLPNCNPCLSPTGTFCGRFTDGGHTSVTLYRWNAGSQSYDLATGLPYGGSAVSNDNLETWSGSVDWAGVFEYPDFAVNSDRWMLMRVGLPEVGDNLSQGCNSVAFSWSDQKAIRITDNGSGISSGTGSLFVEGGPAGSCQGVNGTWSAVQPVELIQSMTIGGTNPYQVTLTSKPAGADFYYTTDGSDPTQSSLHASGPITLNVAYDQAPVFKTRAFMAGKAPSGVMQKRFVPYASTGTGLTFELWKNIVPGPVTTLTSDPRYPGSPDQTWLATSLRNQWGGWWTQSQMWDDSFGGRLRGYYIPPVTGDYKFRLGGYENLSLRLGTSSNPASAVEIANIVFTTWVYPAPSDSSVNIRLQAGQWYYIELLENPTKDQGSVWGVSVTLPWGEVEGPVPGYRLMPMGSVPVQSIAPKTAPLYDARTPSATARVVVYDALGAVVSRQSARQSGTLRMQVPGVYFVQIIDGTNGAVRRMVVKQPGAVVGR